MFLGFIKIHVNIIQIFLNRRKRQYKRAEGCFEINGFSSISKRVPRIIATPIGYLLVGLVVKASASRAGDPGFDCAVGVFPGRVLLGAWRYRVSAEAGRPGVSIL